MNNLVVGCLLLSFCAVQIQGRREVRQTEDSDFDIFTRAEARTSKNAGDSCNNSPDRVSGVCTPLRSCTQLYNLYKNNRNQETINVIKKSLCGKEGRKVLVCCAQELTAKTSLLPQLGECGGATDRRIFGGQKTILGEFPWSALLGYKSKGSSNGRFACGGSLINKRYVLTAAHCGNDYTVDALGDLVLVRLGEWDTSKKDDCLPTQGCSLPPQNFKVEEFVPHPQYNQDDPSNKYDIALVRLKKDAQYTNFVQPICLPKMGQEIYYGSGNEEHMWVSGWGRTETGEKSSIKMKLKVPRVAIQGCQAKYAQKNVLLESDKQMCAGGEADKDSCDGDSGGGLVSLYGYNDGEDYAYFCTGIVSFGPTPCGRKGVPGVYTRVNAFTDWIVANLKP